MTVIAQNYCKDLRRRDRRLLRFLSATPLPEDLLEDHEQRHPLEQVAEEIDQERLFVLVADEISHFPQKQRTALLTDLANLMHFDDAATPLQAAFLSAGIHLEHYRHTPSTNSKEHNRHVSLLSHAYKRVAHLTSIHKYLDEDALN